MLLCLGLQFEHSSLMKKIQWLVRTDKCSQLSLLPIGQLLLYLMEHDIGFRFSFQFSKILDFSFSSSTRSLTIRILSTKIISSRQNPYF